MNNPQTPTNEGLKNAFPEIAFSLENEFLRNELNMSEFKGRLCAGRKKSKIYVPLTGDFTMQISPTDLQADNYQTWFIQAFRHTKPFLEKQEVFILRVNVSIEYRTEQESQVLFSGSFMSQDVETLVSDVLKKCLEVKGKPLLPLNKSGFPIMLDLGPLANPEHTQEGKENNE